MSTLLLLCHYFHFFLVSSSNYLYSFVPNYVNKTTTLQSTHQPKYLLIHFILPREPRLERLRLPLKHFRDMNMFPPQGGSRPSGIHKPQRNVPPCAWVLVCSVDLINDICIKLLSPCGMENSRNNIFYHPRVCDIFQIEYVNSYILFNGYHNALSFVVTWLDCADKHSNCNLT